MEDETLNKIKDLVEKRKARVKNTGGEMFAFWGTWALCGYFTYFFIWMSIFVWIIMILVGLAVQIIYVRYLETKAGYKIFWFGNASQFWVFNVVMMPFIFYIFPDLLKIYPSIATIPIMLLWLSI